MDLAPYRTELLAYCYRMTGSFQDAEDLVQEALLRAWKARAGYDPQRASVRTWLYRITTNVCLTALSGRARRPLPAGLGAPGEDPGAPLTPTPEVPWLEPFPDRRFDLAARADLRLAWLAAVQTLPARQRAVLVLREVLEFSAAEVAEQLAPSVAAVNSTLQRARRAVRELDGAAEQYREPADPEVQAVAQRYLRAFEAADVPELVRLLAADMVLEMPPVAFWLLGPAHYGQFMERAFRLRGRGWRARLEQANGQPALIAYAPDPAGGHRLHSVQLLTVAGALVTRTTVYTEPRVLACFELPAEFPPRAR
ncbi:RNA polymerase subunit sigma-70 [Streptomyces tateyamensis]|uniref:RNA polymerase sigma factor n=1 Tax=Streptomyces tateyamensis TaxID=565073 RepID=A0A2V4P598_9ACTN|nr:RNA polymerase subunit sigma-70 [Streptomyces tateyamensis]PYC85345.1 RNA polymerase subunit sigma-70 [Streptomyces tateyamensis]